MATNENTINSDEELKKMSKTEFYARSLFWVLLFTAVTVAVVFGMHRGIKYIESLNLYSYTATQMTYVIAVLGYLITGFVGVKTANAIEKAYYAMTVGRVQKTGEAPAAAAA
jgi:hypothetical protein